MNRLPWYINFVDKGECVYLKDGYVAVVKVSGSDCEKEIMHVARDGCIAVAKVRERNREHVLLEMSSPSFEMVMQLSKTELKQVAYMLMGMYGRLSSKRS